MMFKKHLYQRAENFQKIKKFQPFKLTSNATLQRINKKGRMVMPCLRLGD